MPIRTHAEDEHVERGGQLAVVGGGRRVQVAALSLHAMNTRRRDRHPREQHLHRHMEVAVGVVARHGTLVAEIDIYPVPVDAAGQVGRRERGVHRSRRRAPRKRNGAVAAGDEHIRHRLRQPRGGAARKGCRRLDDELQRHASTRSHVTGSRIEQRTARHRRAAP